MFIDPKVTKAQRELEYQRCRWRHEDNLLYTTVEMMFPRLVPDGYGGVNVQDTHRAKDYRNTLRRIATMQNLLRQDRA